MTRSILLLTTLLCSIVCCHAQKINAEVNYVTTDGTNNPNNIFYTKGTKVSWDDFKGKPKEETDVAAVTNAGFGIKLAFRQQGSKATLVIDVHCSFSKKDSWVKKNQKNAYILNHEQRHFDIAYIYTKMFIKRLKAASYPTTNYTSVIEKIYNQTAVDMEKKQNEYDRESDHSRITDKQSEWNETISGLLEEALES